MSVKSLEPARHAGTVSSDGMSGPSGTAGLGSVRFHRLVPASAKASSAARGSSRKRDTRCELLLRSALHRLGLRYRVAPRDVAGRPDVVFRRQRVAVFCDGDFWHGRDLDRRLARLAHGHNPGYWTAKIARNVERDRWTDNALRALGWVVLRFWESEIQRDADAIARSVRDVLEQHRTDKLRR